mgnify:CR=1 FL=1
MNEKHSLTTMQDDQNIEVQTVMERSKFEIDLCFCKY